MCMLNEKRNELDEEERLCSADSFFQLVILKGIWNSLSNSCLYNFILAKMWFCILHVFIILFFE